MTKQTWAEPWRIKMVEPIKMTSLEDRQQAIEKAGFNTFLLEAKDVYIDLLTDSGTSAMSDRQWASMMLGDEAYAGSRNYYNLESAVRKHYGFKHLIPTHQGRGAEHILSQLLISDGDYIPGNMYFTTTKFHQVHAGGTFVDVIIDEAHDPENEFPFKGNVDLFKLQELITEVGANRIPYLSLETNVNMAGGQPCSMQNIKETYELCKANNIHVFLDATRAVENAWFIKQREDGYSSWNIKDILLKICSFTDGCTMSGKKDSLVNIGGFLAVNDNAIATRARNMLVAYEGLHTYGGMAGRDMEAMATGIAESVQEEHIGSRVGQVEYLGDKLISAGIPIVKPIGSHGIFINAASFLKHLPRKNFPAQSLAAAIYCDSGVRSMERGTVSAGRDANGENIYPKLELVRLAIPRRVYTQSHMDIVAESIISVWKNRQDIRGLVFEYEPSDLRFFQCRFALKEDNATSGIANTFNTTS